MRLQKTGGGAIVVRLFPQAVQKQDRERLLLREAGPFPIRFFRRFPRFGLVLELPQRLELPFVDRDENGAGLARVLHLVRADSRRWRRPGGGALLLFLQAPQFLLDAGPRRGGIQRRLGRRFGVLPGIVLREGIELSQRKRSEQRA